MTTEQWLTQGIDTAWRVLLVWWLWSAWGNKTATRGEPWLTRLTLYWLPLVIAFGLLGPSFTGLNPSMPQSVIDITLRGHSGPDSTAATSQSGRFSPVSVSCT